MTCILGFFEICNAQTQKVDIYSDGILLNAYFYQTGGGSQNPTLIWCHGNPGGKEEGGSAFAQELNRHGVNVLRFNYRGLWGTPGTFKMSNSIEDLSSVLDFIYEPVNIHQFNIDTSVIIVGGYSYGTTVVMVSALNDNRIKKLFCLGLADHNHFYFTPESLDPDNKERWREPHPYVNDVLWGPNRNFDEIKNEFNLDIMRYTYEYDFVSQAENLKDKEIYIIVGLNDLTAPIEYHFLPLHRKFIEMNHSHYIYRIVESDHAFGNLPVSERAQIISNWLME
jgi:pimeloyl-ACP methyl ester carboxylesterase